MKKSKLIKILTISFLFTTLAFFIVRCSKDKPLIRNSKELKNPALSFISTTISGNYDKDIAVWVNQQYDFYAAQNSFTAHSNMDIDNTDVSTIRLNNTFYTSPNGYYEMMNMKDTTSNGVFGYNSSISASSGSKMSGFTKSIYVPKMFIPTFTGFTTNNSGTSVSRSQGFSINWNSDTSNMYDVLVYIEQADSNNFKEIYLPNTITGKSFTSTDLTQFGNNSDITIRIARGNVVYTNVSGKEVQIRAGVLEAIPVTLKP